jgi:uncharacterized repeat protein (TIGR02543 family)
VKKSKMSFKLTMIFMVLFLLGLFQFGEAQQEKEIPIKMFSSAFKHIPGLDKDAKEIIKKVRKEFKLYYKEEKDRKFHQVALDLVDEEKDREVDYLFVYFMANNTYKTDVSRIILGDNYDFLLIEDNYIPGQWETSAELEGEADGTCPDNSVEILLSTCETGIPTAVSAINTSYNEAVSAGYTARKLFGSEENTTDIDNWLCCPNLIYWGRVGHGYTGGIVLDDGNLTYSYFNSLETNALQGKVLYFNSCQVFNDPLKSSILNKNALKFIGGICNLYIGSSEEVFKCWNNKNFNQVPPPGGASDEMCYWSVECESSTGYPEPGCHGCGGPGLVFPTVGAPQAPDADFTASPTTVMQGETVTFTDTSAYNPTSWSWTFEGGTPAASTAQNPTVTYNDLGTYEVSLTASNAYGSDTETKTDYIDVVEKVYCTSSSNDYSYEYIAGVQVGDLNNTSGATGYTDFTYLAASLVQDAAVSVSLTPGFSGSSYMEYWKIWIDYNGDSDFADTGEEVFSGSGSSTVTGSFTVPTNTITGDTRMRVSMQYNAPPPYCGTFTYGEVEDYTVTINTTGLLHELTVNTVGQGSVTLDPAGGSYPYGTEVTLTAVPDAGWQFDGWSGDLSGTTNPATITMDDDKTVTATFSEVTVPQYTLTVNTVGNGSVTLDPPGGTYNEGTVVTLTAAADSGWQFDNWSGDLTGSTNPATITMDANKTVTANFSEVTGTSTVGNTTVFGTSTTTANRRAMPFTMPENGTISSVAMYHTGGSGNMILGVYDGTSSAPNNRLGVTASTAVSGSTGWQTINLTSPCFVASGSTVWLAWVYQSNPGIYYETGSPGRAHSDDGWSGGMPDPFGSSTQSSYIYSIYADYTPSAPPQYTVTVNVVGSGSVALNPPGGVYDAGTEVTLTATADTGWQFDGWSGDLSGSANPAVITVNSDMTITANFSEVGTTGTVGYETVFGSTSVSTYRRAMPFTMPENGTITSVTMYHTGGSGSMILGVYDGEGTPANRLGVTAATAVSGSTGWQTINLTSPAAVTGGQTVWLAWVYESNPGIAYQTGDPGRYQSTQTWPGMPDPFGSGSQSSYIYSIYATYNK